MTAVAEEVRLEAIHPGTEEEMAAMPGEDCFDPVTREARPLISLSGRWRDFPRFTIPLPPKDLHYRFFEDQSSFYRTFKIRPVEINNAKVEQELADCDHLQRRSTFNVAEYGPYMSKLFRFGSDYSWRPAREEERLHHRGAGGSICVTLEQLKAGLRFPMHRFMWDLVCVHLKCSISQITPNAIRAINWFIASCTALAKQPTFKAFFHLFNIKTSTAKPFVELPFANKSSVIGRELVDYMPFDFPNSMTDWQYEFLVVAGGELAWMPNMARKVEKSYRAPRDQLSAVDVEILVGITKALGSTWTKSAFFENGRLQLYLRKFLTLLNVGGVCFVFGGFVAL